MDIVKIDVDEITARALSEHRRKASQLEAIQSHLGQVLDNEDLANEIGRDIMKRVRPNDQSGAREEISITDQAKQAAKGHSRKVSQFAAVKNEIGKYFSEEEANELAKEVMKDINPNIDSGIAKKVPSVDEIVDNALKKHKREQSINQAITNDLGLIYHKDDVNAIARQVMKDVFTEKIKSDLKDENLADEKTNDEIEKLKEEIESLNEELNDKNLEIKFLKQTIQHLSESKQQMALNANKSLNQMRSFLVKYQKQLGLIKKDEIKED